MLIGKSGVLHASLEDRSALGDDLHQHLYILWRLIFDSSNAPENIFARRQTLDNVLTRIIHEKAAEVA
jgi:hypothetical protein